MANTKAAVYARLYGRYKIKEFAILFQPFAAANQVGALKFYIDQDPDFGGAGNGLAAIQIADAHDGSATCQAWQAGLCSLPVDMLETDLFLSQGGSDDRLTMFGTFVALAGVANPTVGPAGEFLAMYEIEFVMGEMNQETASSGASASFVAAPPSSPTAGNPYGTQGITQYAGAENTLYLSSPGIPGVGGVSQLYGFPMGVYDVEFWISGTGLGTTPSIAAVAGVSSTAITVTTPQGKGAVVNTGATASVCTARINVTSDNSNWLASGVLKFSTNGMSSAAVIAVYIYEVPTAFQVALQGSLQDYERETEELKCQVQALTKQVAVLMAPLTPSDPPAGVESSQLPKPDSDPVADQIAATKKQLQARTEVATSTTKRE